jgi:hypothetical protein
MNWLGYAPLLGVWDILHPPKTRDVKYLRPLLVLRLGSIDQTELGLP